MNPEFYSRQLKMAREILNEKGINALWNPHGMTGKLCGCGDCFCCAAYEVYFETRLKLSQHSNASCSSEEAA